MIALGADHGGFHLKEAAKEYLKEKGIEFTDFGIYEEKSVDYPDIAKTVCEAIQSGKCRYGIVLRNGHRMSIAATSIWAFCAVSARLLSAKYKNAQRRNVLCLAAG